MAEKVKAIYGSDKREQDVKQWLKDHGAKDSSLHKIFCDSEKTLFFVKQNGDVDYVQNESFFFLFDIEELPRWRAERSATYFYINEKLRLDVETEEYHKHDDELYSCGNYFQSSEEAGKYRDEIIKMLKKRNL